MGGMCLKEKYTPDSDWGVTEWTCPSLGHAGKAWGIRSSFPKDDLIFLAVAE